MRIATTVLVLLAAIGAAPAIFAVEPKCCPAAACAASDGCQPQGGWYPYGGGLFNWWPRCCFPNCGGPDDYCRKPLPCVCWPNYPEYFQFGPPDVCCVERSCGVSEQEVVVRRSDEQAPASLQ